MGAYIARRALQGGVLLLLVSLVSYGIMNLAPGGPLAVYLHNPQVTPEKIDLLRHQLGLDQPWYTRYLAWLGGLLQGHWGYSYYSGQPVLEMIAERLPATFLLMLSAFALALSLSFPLGIFAATHKYSWGDNLLSLGSFFAWAMPTFWFGLILQLVLAVRFRLLPVAGMHEIGDASIGDLLRHLVMPAMVLGLGSIASWSRYLRSSMLEVLGQDYVRTAQAKGLPWRRVLNRHVLRNSLIPIVTLMGLDLPVLFSGAVITESIFGWPGMGRLFLSALNNRDYPLQMAGLIISAALLIAGNLLADLAYAALDPRIRYE
ncbi:MAG TPA: ABC transporter permease [bacterium]|nr:ABC transporter permease [bacterium]